MAVTAQQLQHSELLRNVGRGGTAEESEKSPTTNTTWFWGEPGQGCSQFGKMILQGAGFSADSSALGLHTEITALCPRFQVSPKYQVDLTLLCLQDSTGKKNQNKAD